MAAVQYDINYQELLKCSVSRHLEALIDKRT